MADHLEIHSGWTLSEALERTADPGLLKSRLAAPAVIEGAPTAVGSDMPRDSAANFLSELTGDLWREFTTSKLAVMGSPEDPGALPTHISPNELATFNVPDWQNSTIEHQGTKTTIFNVRIFPVLASPVAAKHLFGLSLAKAFRKFVFEDPEVVALSKRITGGGGYVEVFRDGLFPRDDSYCWPLDVMEKDLAYSFVSVGISFPDQEAPTIPSEILRVAKALCERMCAFRTVLSNGRVRGGHLFTQE